MYCPTCGGQNEDGNEYCVTCGAKLAQEQAAAKSDDLKKDVLKVKQRHGCLTAYLIVIIVITSLGVVTIPILPTITEFIQQQYPDYTFSFTWATWVALVASVAQIAFVVAIYKWKKWGVYGFVGATIAELALSSIDTDGITGISGVPGITAAFATTVSIIMSVIVGILTIVLLVVALKMGRPSGWDQLE